MSHYIVKVDIGEKQRYIFSSNRLKDIIGASEIIRFVSNELGGEVIKQLGFNPSKFHENKAGNILFVGGGNAFYIFDDNKNAIRFNKLFSKIVVEHFEGLELTMAVSEFDIQNKSIITALNELEERINEKKGMRVNNFKRLGFGLTKRCPNTRKPAGYTIKTPDGDKVVSKETHDKHCFYYKVSDKKRGEQDNNELFVEWDGKRIAIKVEKKDMGRYLTESFRGLEFPTETDELSGKKQKNANQDGNGIEKKIDESQTAENNENEHQDREGCYLGITCLDGNGMGKKIEKFQKKHRTEIDKAVDKTQSNAEYIEKFWDLTKEIKTAFENAFKSMVTEICKSNVNDDIGVLKDFVPIRPIILAGDDVCFISNGRIAIDAARIFAEKVDKEKIVAFENRSISISSGTAIMHTTYPFSRAVALATDLEKSSKKKIADEKKCNENYDASFMDWQITRGDYASMLSEIRDPNKTARPYCVCDNGKKSIQYNISHFQKIMSKLLSEEIGMSKMQNFFRSMNVSNDEAELFIKKYQLEKVAEGLSTSQMKEIFYDAIEISGIYKAVGGGQK